MCECIYDDMLDVYFVVTEDWVQSYENVFEAMMAADNFNDHRYLEEPASQACQQPLPPLVSR